MRQSNALVRCLQVARKAARYQRPATGAGRMLWNRQMKFTLSWLKEYLETEAPIDEIGDKLTAIGLEVEAIEDQAAALAPFTVAHVVSAGEASGCRPASGLHCRYR